MTNPNYEAVIGLEVHVELATKSKMFCSCNADWFGKKPNRHVCPVCMALPGALPVANRQALEWCMKVGLALNCSIAEESKFDRKNYFYPDLPKGYQISQYDQPICYKGSVTLTFPDGREKVVGITRIHQEEDTGKLMHDNKEGIAYLDLNRSGVPLIEIVSEPDMSTAEEAKLYMQMIRQTVRYLGVSDGDMDKGSLRCDANISVRKKGDKKLGVKVEVKNMNSFRAVERALLFEMERQTQALENGEKIVQETRGWNEGKQLTYSQRVKEEASDYRYFPEPDIPPMHFGKDVVGRLKKEIPELGFEKYVRFQKDYGIGSKEAAVLSETKEMADFYELAVSLYEKEDGISKAKAGKAVSNWILTSILGYLKDNGQEISDLPIEPAGLVELLVLVKKGIVSQTAGTQVIESMMKTGKSASAVIEEKGLKQVSDTGELEKIVEQVIVEHPEEVAKFKAGKEVVLGFLVGQAMRLSKGKGNPKIIGDLLRKNLR